MKAQLSKLIGTTLLGLCLFSHDIPARAGQVAPFEVGIGGGGASGTMMGARYSADNKQYIGCQFWNNAGPFVTCGARNSVGQTFACYSNQQQHVAVLKAITHASRFGFGSTANNPSVCSDLWVENNSAYIK